MSPPPPENPAPVRDAVVAELGRPPVSTDPAMSDLREAVVGDPVLARSPHGTPAFWLVPLLLGTHAGGFARVDLSCRVTQIGRFGAGPKDHASRPEAAFFRQPPPGPLAQLQDRHAGQPMTKPVFSYDGSPAKWAWRIAVGQPVTTVAFITPGGTYEKPASAPSLPDREG